MKLLEVKHLTTEFKTEQGIVQAVRDVSFEVNKGEVLGIVGESGSGKSVTMFSIMGLLAANGYVKSGDIKLLDHDISSANLTKAQKKAYEQYMQGVRGHTMSMIFQDPMTFLNPLLSVKKQLIEPLMIHKKLSKKAATLRAIELMREVGIPSPETRIKQYPHQFSGGMRQRIIIAMALACRPQLIIADEPTTALDVTIQAQVLELIQSIQKDTQAAVLMITHDLGVVANMCDRVIIMYGGKIVEEGRDQDIFYKAKHPYTQGLLNSINNPDKEHNERLKPIPGSPPDLLNPPVGCPFVDRCDQAMRICKQQMPPETIISSDHKTSCWLMDERAMERRGDGE